mmetsp:Transcript_55099/g.98317  ORF Transcript_55099/g.98317 Transcript_55099/m.98317 type:complete len:205 (-) Transcript_55099:87-701(-)
MATPKYKVVFVGDQSVGKTSLIVRYLKNMFDEKVDATIGMDFQTKTVKLNESQNIRLQLWDTAGQERFRSLVTSYIRDAAAAVVCFDITKRETFDNTGRWIEEVRSARGDDALIFLVGNKADVEDQRQVTTQEMQEKAEQMRASKFIEASAKTGDKVQDLFQMLAEALMSGSERAPGSRQAEPTVQLGAVQSEDAERKKKACQC